MPYRDATGPNGQGPLTGRGLGPCGSGNARGFGRGFGRGFNGFRGLRGLFSTKRSTYDAMDIEEYIEYLKEELDDALKKLAEIKKD